MFDERTCCLFAPSLIALPHLIDVELDKEPSACIKTGDWSSAGLADLPNELVHLAWVDVIKFLSKINKVSSLCLSFSRCLLADCIFI
jgi:hypothetical protein